VQVQGAALRAEVGRRLGFENRDGEWGGGGVREREEEAREGAAGGASAGDGDFDGHCWWRMDWWTEKNDRLRLDIRYPVCKVEF
jgi:hypothetical protein